MNESPETRLFRAYWSDGILDLVAGCAVVLIGVGYLFELMLAPAVVAPLALASWFILRKRLVEPRAGYVEFSSRRRRKAAAEVRGAAAIGLGVMALVLVFAFGGWGKVFTMREAVAALPAFLVALAALIASGLSRSWRFSVYALVLVLSGVITILIGDGPAFPLVVGGAVISACGAVLLVRFIVGSRDFDAGNAV